MPIQVLVESILSVIASIDPIRIQTWNNLKHKIVSQYLCLYVISKMHDYYLAYSLVMKLIIPLRTCEAGTSPVCTQALRKTVGLLNL